MSGFPNNQSNPAGAVPVYLVQGSSAVGSGNPLPTSGGGSGSGSTFTYQTWVAKTAATGYAVGDLIQQVEEWNASVTPATYVGTLWRNLTQETTLAGAPAAANITPISTALGATAALQTNNQQTTQIVDASGNSVVTISGNNSGPALLAGAGPTQFTFSTGNTSTAQLASNATFTGSIETVVFQAAVTVGLTSDQAGTLTLNQFIDAAGTYLESQMVFAIAAGVGFNRAFALAGNYFQVVFKNTGAGTTTTLNINTAYGTLPATSQLGNNSTAINEIGGVALSSSNLPVNVAQINGKALGSIEGTQNFRYALPVCNFAPQPYTDRASAAITTTGNTGTIADDFAQTLSALVSVTAVSGTNPTLDLMLSESFDGGTTYQDIYHVARFTAAGTYTVPNIVMGGKRQWRWVIGGTGSPSFTVTITAMDGSNSPLIVRQFFDRNIVPTTLSSTTSTYNIEGCKNVTMTLCSGAATTGATIQLQYSSDGVNFYSASTALLSVANSTVAVVSSTGMQAKFARAIVTVVGAAQTLTYVNIFGTN